MLDFEEFLAIQPRAVRAQHSIDTIRSWFDSADSDGDGRVNVNEFFVYSLGAAAANVGPGALARVFERYDKDGSGMLDMLEFTQLAERMGFGAVAAG